MEYRKELEMFTAQVANCGKAIRIYEGLNFIGEVVKDDASRYLTENDISLVKQVYSSIKERETIYAIAA